jgi:hypothetical protein
MLNDQDLVLMLSFTAAILGVTTLGLAIAWVRTREKLLRARAVEIPAPTDQQSVRRLEEAVDAIALEVERIAEGQRYVTKLLGDRAEYRLPAGETNAPRPVTPH